MKKFVALLMALCLLGACALAEEVPVINWEDVDIESTGIEGNYYTFDSVAVVVWIPTVLENLELTAEEAEGGLIGKFEVADGSAGIYVQHLTGNEGATMDELLAGLEANGAKDIERCVLNGLDAASYSLPDADAMYVVFVTEAGNYVQFVMTPVSDEGFASVAQIVTASIQPE